MKIEHKIRGATGMGRIGFDVEQWRAKPLFSYSNDELLEYWHKLRLVCKKGEVTASLTSAEMHVLDLQKEIISRMSDNA